VANGAGLNLAYRCFAAPEADGVVVRSEITDERGCPKFRLKQS